MSRETRERKRLNGWRRTLRWAESRRRRGVARVLYGDDRGARPGDVVYVPMGQYRDVLTVGG